MAKKIIVNIVLLCMFINVFSVTPALAKGDEITAFAVFGSGAYSKGINVSVGTTTSMKPEITEKAGRTCYLLSKNVPHINLSVSEEMKNNDGSEYVLEIDYFEEVNAGFRVVYDSKTQDEPLEAGQVYHSIGGFWRTVSYTIKDAAFNKGIDGLYDIRITVDYAGKYPVISQAIGEVRLTKKVARNPIYAQSTTEQVGHTFRWFDEEKIITTTFENLSDDTLTAKVTHKLVDTNNRTGFELTEDISFEPHEKKETSFDFGKLQYCDIYMHYIDIEIEEGNIVSQFVPLQIAIIKTDPDGVKKESAYWSVHMDRYTDEQNAQLAQMLSYTNIAGVRYNLTWRDIEPTKGSYSWSSSAEKSLNGFNHLKKYGIKYVPLLFGSSTQHVESYKSFPKTEAQLNAYASHLKNIIDTIGDDIDYYEIWNEPNVATFNADIALGGSAYVPMFKAASETIKKYDPTAKIGALCLAGPANEGADKFWTEAMNAGLGDSKPDAVVLHPYTDPYGRYPELSGMVERLQYYKDDYKKRTGDELDIWLTEYGVTVNRNKPTPTYREKGANDVRCTIMFESSGTSVLSSMYVFEEDILLDSTNAGGRFGAVTGFKEEFTKYGKNLIPNEAYLMNSAYYYVAADAKYEKNYEFNNSQIRITHLKSNKFNGDLLTLHRLDGEELVTLDLGADKVTLYDCKGNSQEIYGKDGVFTFLAEFAPKYIVGNIKHINYVSEQKNLINIDKLNVSTTNGDVININFENNTGIDINVEIEDSEKIELLSTSYDETNNKKGTVSLMNNLPSKSKSYIDLLFYDDNGRLIQKTDILINSLLFAESKFKIDPILNGKNLSWNGILDVKNSSQGEALNGYIRIKSPQQFVDNVKYPIIIPKERTQRISIPIRNMTRCEQYTVNYELVKDNGEVMDVFNTINPVAAIYNEKKPTIDGIVNKGEWLQGSTLYADTADRLQKIVGWKGPSDLSMKTVVNWDNQFMYMLIEVTDDIHYVVNNISNSWNDDSIQFGMYYASEEDIESGNIPSAYTRFITALVAEGAQLSVSSFQDEIVSFSKGLVEGGQVAINRTGNKTVYELSVPWGYITGDKIPQKGEYLGFCVMANDNDGTGRRGWIEFGSGVGSGNNTALFTIMKLL